VVGGGWEVVGGRWSSKHHGGCGLRVRAADVNAQHTSRLLTHSLARWHCPADATPLALNTLQTSARAKKQAEFKADAWKMADAMRQQVRPRAPSNTH
jgi:hypothetical protein